MSKSRAEMTELQLAQEKLNTLKAQRENHRDYNNQELKDEIAAVTARVAELAKPANDEVKAAAEQEQKDAEEAARVRAEVAQQKTELEQKDAEIAALKAKLAEKDEDAGPVDPDFAKGNLSHISGGKLNDDGSEVGPVVTRDEVKAEPEAPKAE